MNRFLSVFELAGTMFKIQGALSIATNPDPFTLNRQAASVTGLVGKGF